MATGSSDAASGVFPPTLLPGIAAPETRIGRGGQPWLSIFPTQPRNAMTWSISWAVSFRFGMMRRSRASL